MHWQEKHAGLHAELLLAHSEYEPVKLAQLYTLCADTAERYSDINAACFYLTHALVYALEGGMDEYKDLIARLEAYGRI